MSRSCYNEFEDVRMLKWVARKDDSEAPLGIALWKTYAEHYQSYHTPQSLNGRLRRQIIPNLYQYAKFLKLTDVQSLYRMFRNRLGEKDQKKIKKYIVSSREMKQEPEANNESTRADPADVTMSRKPIIDDIDEMPPSYTRKITVPVARETNDGPSTSTIQTPKPTLKIPQKQTVIGEVSSTAKLDSDDEDDVETREAVKQNVSPQERDKSPEDLSITMHNVVGVVSSTASVHNDQEEPTTSTRAKKTSVVSLDDEDVFLAPKSSPLKKMRRREGDEEVYLCARSEKMTISTKRPENEDLIAEIRPKKTPRPVCVVEDVNENPQLVSSKTTTPKSVAASSKPSSSKKVHSDDDDLDLLEDNLSKKTNVSPLMPFTVPREEQVEHGNASGHTSRESTPRRSKTPENQNHEELSEPDDDDYVSPSASPIPKEEPLYSDLSYDDVEDIFSKTRPITDYAFVESPNTTQFESSVKETQKQSPAVAKIQKTPTQKILNKSLPMTVEKVSVKLECEKTPSSSKPVKNQEDDDDDDEDDSEVAKVMRAFTGTLSSAKIHKKNKKKKASPTPQKQPAKPAEEEDEDLVDRIMATIKEREQEVAAKSLDEKEDDEEQEPTSSSSKKSSDAGMTSSGVKQVVGTPTAVTPIKRKRPSYKGMPPPKDDRPDYHWKLDSAGKRRWQRKPGWLLEMEADEKKAKAPEKKENEQEPTSNSSKKPSDVIMTSSGAEKNVVTPTTVTPIERERPSYSGMPPPKDDRPDYHWKLDSAGTRRWQRKPGWLLELEADEKKAEKSKCSESARMAEKSKSESSVKAKKPESAVETVQSVKKRGRPSNQQKLEKSKDDTPVDVDTDMPSCPKRARRSTEKESEADNTPRRCTRASVRTLFDSQKAAEADLQAKRKDEVPLVQALKSPTKRRRGRPSKKLNKEVSDDRMPGTSSSHLRSPPVEMKVSLQSTISGGADQTADDRDFSFKQWNLDMRPVAEQAARNMYSAMFQQLEQTASEKEIEDVVQGANMQQLFDKMFKEDAQQGSEDFVIVGVEGFTAKKLRMKYFLKMKQDLKHNTTTCHVRSAVLTFFQYFEYTIASSVIGMNTEPYVFLLDRLVEIANQLATF